MLPLDAKSTIYYETRLLFNIQMPKKSRYLHLRHLEMEYLPTDEKKVSSPHNTLIIFLIIVHLVLFVT